MKLSIKQQDTFLLEGSGKEYRMLASHLLSQTNEVPSVIDNPEIATFYQIIISLSSKDVTDTIPLSTTDACIEWIIESLSLLPKVKEETKELLSDLQSQYFLLKKDKKEMKPGRLKDTLTVEYQHVLGMTNIKRMTAFMESFELSDTELQHMVLMKFLDTYSALKTEDIRMDMLERMYHTFFEEYQPLLIETHLLYPFPVFKEKLSSFYAEESERVGIIWVNEEYMIAMYLLYFDMFQKGVKDGFIYQAENDDMVFDWFKPLFIQVAVEHQQKMDKEDENQVIRQEKEMNVFRDIYIRELSKCFPDIEKIEDDKETPYNVVFVLKGNRRVVCNTLKHYEDYMADAVIGYDKERVKSMEEFIRKIAPVQKKSSSIDLFDTSFVDVKEQIYPMIRELSHAPAEAICSPLVEGIGIFYGILIEAKGKTQYAMIMNSMVSKWGIDIHDLKQISLRNLQRKQPKLITYQEVMQNHMAKENLLHLPQSYRELYLYAGKSAIDSSYLLDMVTLERMKETLKTDSLLLSIPVRDCLLITKKEHISLLKEISGQLYQTQSAKLFLPIIEWVNGEWRILE